MKSDDPVTRETVERLCVQADLPLAPERQARLVPMLAGLITAANELNRKMAAAAHRRSEEHTSELQSQSNIVCRLLLEKNKKHTLYTQCIRVPSRVSSRSGTQRRS